MELSVTQHGIVDIKRNKYIAQVGMDGKIHFDDDDLKHNLNRWLADVCRKYPFNIEVDKNRVCPP